MSGEKLRSPNVDSREIAQSCQFEHLIAEAIKTLQTLLSSEQLSAQERADLALKILELDRQQVNPQIRLAHQGDRSLSSYISQSRTAQNHPSQERASKPGSDLISQVLQIDNFLSTEENSQLLHYALAREAAFVPSSTATNAIAYRRSSVLHDFPEFSRLIRERIHAVFPYVLKQLGIPAFAIAQIEAQLTAHADSNYYKIHNDNGSPEAATRELTYVYYFCREPRPFSGGELRIYDSRVEQGHYTQADSFQTITPRNNSIVFFLSRYMHEVLPIHCPSKSFADSRFTINGWLRRELSDRPPN